MQDTVEAQSIGQEGPQPDMANKQHQLDKLYLWNCNKCHMPKGLNSQQL